MAEVPEMHVRLDRYVEALRAADPRWTGDLNPALPEELVREDLAKFVANPVQELVDLWTWRNGQHLQTQQPLMRAYYFRPLAATTIEMFRSVATETRRITTDEGLFWPEVSDAIPVLFSPGGQWVFVDSGDGPDRGYVFEGDSQDLVPAIRLFNSLATAVGVAHERIERGIWTVGRDLLIRDERFDYPPPDAG